MGVLLLFVEVRELRAALCPKLLLQLLSGLRKGGK
jgi:hypothetical protein